MAKIRDFVGERYGSSVWSSMSKSELVAILVDSHNFRATVSELVDNEILLQLEALRLRNCYRLHPKRLQLYRNVSI